MEPINWAPEHSDALREGVARGMSFSKIAEAINLKFNTAYSRNAVIGRAKRMGLAAVDRPPCRMGPRPDRPHEPRADQPRSLAFSRPPPACAKPEPVRLQCVEIEPRHLSLIELERDDCRYPYGGDLEGEAITFCGHPRRSGASYCTPHFRLSRNPDLPPELQAPPRSAWWKLREGRAVALAIFGTRS